jgi:hypothetical protein
VVLFFSMQSPEVVDRWLWLPFILALCFRDRGAATPPEPDDDVARREPAPPVAASLPVPAPAPRRVSGTVPARLAAAPSW